jgi:hypothetical protein
MNAALQKSQLNPIAFPHPLGGRGHLSGLPGHMDGESRLQGPSEKHCIPAEHEDSTSLHLHAVALTG